MNKIDPVRAKRIINKILDTEQENLKTKKLNNDAMIERLKKIIEEEVRKCY